MPRRNEQCPCGSNKKYKKCCLIAEREYEELERQRKVIEMLVDKGLLRIPSEEELQKLGI